MGPTLLPAVVARVAVDGPLRYAPCALLRWGVLTFDANEPSEKSGWDMLVWGEMERSSWAPPSG